MSEVSIGGPVTNVACVLKPGQSGILQIAFGVVKPTTPPTPLDSYDGWEARLAVARTQTGTPEIDLTVDCQGDPGGQRILAAFEFETNTTKDLRRGVLIGDVVLKDPDGDLHYWLNIQIKVDDSKAVLE